ncbi:MAG: hypothetical protein Q8J99_09520, partial [Sulfuritalea sp.]|nr:hypothetical protein [Sulfuritalea sp.]
FQSFELSQRGTQRGGDAALHANLDEAGELARQMRQRGFQPVALMGADHGRQFADQAGPVIADDGKDEMLCHGCLLENMFGRKGGFSFCSS